MTRNNTSTLIFTGGHHTSALALALKLREIGWNIIWIGHQHSSWGDKSESAEYIEVRRSGIKFYNLYAGKVYHTYNPFKLARLPIGLVQSLLILIYLKYISGLNVRGIVTFGGYLGAPVTVSGWFLNIPTIAHEQTVTAGWANKIISLFSKYIAVTWPSSKKYYPENKVVLTGIPFRPEIINVLNKPPIRNTKQIYITGGKQGSHIINTVVFSVLEKLLTEYTLIHQTGSSSLFSDYQTAVKYKKILPVNLKNKYRVQKYLNAKEAALAISTSEIVISRSGAHITQELALLKTKCILIPISWSSHNEQYLNAKVLSDNNQAIIIPESNLNSNTILKAINDINLKSPKYIDNIVDGMKNIINLISETIGNP